MRAWLSVCLVALACAAVASPSEFIVRVFPLFHGSQASQGFVPLLADITNAGLDARGSLTVRCNGYQVSYPVELPQSADKELIVYTLAGGGSAYDTTVELSTNQGSVTKPVDPPA